MRIVHYSLGFPPYRTGGMTKYCLDIMEEQIKAGHDVAMLWPGKIKKYGDECKIVKGKKYKLNNGIMCENYELRNPLPISLLNGIKDVSAYTAYRDIDTFITFFQLHEVNAFHIHTLMGLPKEALIAAKEAKVRIVYTSHDYFGICPRASLVFGNHICRHSLDCENCTYCNEGALSLRKIQLIQNPVYRVIKDNFLVKKIRKYAIKKQRERSNQIDKIIELGDNTYDKSGIKKYEKLRAYYYSIFELIDMIHFNSSVTAEVYHAHEVPINSEKILLITHKGIKNQHIEKHFEKTIRFSYLGAFSTRKGCELLIETLDKIQQKGYDNFKLNVFATFPYERTYIEKGQPYKYDQIESVFQKTDVLILPSIWNETFGFTVLEALSYGVPAIVSSHAGSKDLIEPGKNGWIAQPNVNEFENVIESILKTDYTELEKMNKYICDKVVIKTMEEHVDEITKLYN